MIFNGIEKDYIYILRGRERPFFAPLQRNFRDIENLVNTDRGVRVMPIPIGIKYDRISDLERLKEDIAGWLVHEKPKRLEFKDDPDRLYYAVVDDTINNGFLYNQATEATINFICGYKYSHERNLSIDDTLTSNIEGHKSTPWKTKTIFTDETSSYELQFNSPGKTDLRDINKIKLNYEFVAGDVLEIDYSKRKITVNDVDRSNILVILQSNYMELPIGEVEFSVSHETELFYHERYY